MIKKKDLLTEHESDRVNGNEIVEKKINNKSEENVIKETHIYIFIKTRQNK